MYTIGQLYEHFRQVKSSEGRYSDPCFLTFLLSSFPSFFLPFFPSFLFPCQFFVFLPPLSYFFSISLRASFFFPSLTLFSQAFEIMPLTFQLPHEYTHFVKAFMEAEQNIKEKDESNSQNFWIMKPVGMSRGRYVRSFTLHPFSFPPSLKKKLSVFRYFFDFHYSLNLYYTYFGFNYFLENT